MEKCLTCEERKIYVGHSAWSTWFTRRIVPAANYNLLMKIVGHDRAAPERISAQRSWQSIDQEDFPNLGGQGTSHKRFLNEIYPLGQDTLAGDDIGRVA